MKKRILFMLLVCAALALCVGAASAEELSTNEVRAELFTEGALPQMQFAQTYAAMEFGDYLFEQLQNQADRINVEAYGFTTDNDSLSALVAAFSDTINTHPDLFYVGGKLGYSSYSDGRIAAIIPEYLYSGEELENRIAGFESSVASIAAYASRATTTLGKLAAVNDYFCANFQYDTTYTVYRPDLLFSGGKGVCQAYMLAYSAVLNKLGIANTYATSNAMNHTWNLVQLDGSWYHIDVTWNDPTADMALRACHGNFLLSDTGIGNAGHYSWTCAVSATNTKYDSAFWMDLNTPLGIWGDKIYYADASVTNGRRTIHCWNASTGATQDLLTYSVAFQDGSAITMNGYSGIAADGNNVYYGALGSLYARPIAGGEAKAIYHTGDDAMQIISCFMQGNTIRMHAKNLREDTSAIHSVNVAEQPGKLVIAPAFAELWPGETLNVTLADENGTQITTGEWEYDAEALAMGEYGVFTAVRPGCYTIAVSLEGWNTAQMNVVVHSEDRFVLPDETTTVGTEAFANTAVVEIILPEGVTTIGEKAFSDCSALLIVHVPDSVEDIADDAFDGENKHMLTILCTEDSEAHQYAIEQEMEFLLVP